MNAQRIDSALGATDRYASQYADIVLLIARVFIGWLLFINGWHKLMNPAGFVGYLTNLGVPAPGFWAWPALLAEFLLGAALILGVATRYAAIAAFIYIIIATLLAHRYWSFPAAQQVNQYNHFLKNIAIMGGLAGLFVTGPGRYSVDEWLKRRA